MCILLYEADGPMGVANPCYKARLKLGLANQFGLPLLLFTPSLF